MKEKIVILQCVDCDQEEIDSLMKLLGKPCFLKQYKFILSNREIEAIDKDELIKILKEATEK